jgi:hypothetical protein
LIEYRNMKQLTMFISPVSDYVIARVRWSCNSSASNSRDSGSKSHYENMLS